MSNSAGEALPSLPCSAIAKASALLGETGLLQAMWVSKQNAVLQGAGNRE